MRKRKKSAGAVRILSGIVSMTTILGSFMGTGLTAYAEEEGNGSSMITTSSPDETVVKETWKKIDGKWYFFGKDGSMAVNRWVKDNGKWYYLGKDGAMVTGWKKISGKWYYFRNGAMRTGWILYKDVWYFLKIAGDMATGWRKIKGTWYYFDSDGRMYSNAYIDRKYFVDENGAWDGVTITDTPDIMDTSLPPDTMDTSLPPDTPDIPVVTDTPDITDITDPPESERSDPVDDVEDGTTTLTFHQVGWYVARLEVQVWDKSKQDFVWIYSDSGAKGQDRDVKIDTDKYEINRVGYQIWFFGWNNDYMNLPWANTDYATDFTLSGYGDYPDFTWK